MNNRNIICIIGIFIIGIILTLLYIFKYDKISSDILDKNWYRYNYINGYYDVFNINEYKMSYYRPSSENYTNQYDKCGNYRYNKKKKTIILDCNKEIVIKSSDKDKLTLLIDGEKNVFYANIDDSLNYEFNKFYGKSMSEYKKSESQVVDLIKLPINSLINTIREKEDAKIIFMGSKCSSVDCLASYDVIEKWLTVSTNTYYINSDELNINITTMLNKINNAFSKEVDFYNEAYPRVIITNGGKIIDSYLIKCYGFNCSAFYNK